MTSRLPEYLATYCPWRYNTRAGYPTTPCSLHRAACLEQSTSPTSTVSASDASVSRKAAHASHLHRKCYLFFGLLCENALFPAVAIRTDQLAENRTSVAFFVAAAKLRTWITARWFSLMTYQGALMSVEP